MKWGAYLVAALAGLMAGGSVAHGAGLAAAANTLGIAEVRAGVLADDVELYGSAPHFIPRLDTISAGNISTLSFDVLFRTPDLDVFRWIGSPRPDIGVDLDFRHESMLHASLNWHIPLGSTRFYIEPEVGVAIHDGQLKDAVAPYRNLGCRELFYWSLNAGYDIDPHWDLTLTLQHASHAGICDPTLNQGINYAGVRLGYKF